MTNIDIDLKLSNQHGREVELLNSPLGRTGGIQLVLPDDLPERLGLLRGGYLARRDTNRLGEQLFKSLLPGRIGEIFQQCKGNPANRVIRLRLDIRDPHLQQVPWELIRDDSVNLALTERFPIIRFEQDFRSASPPPLPEQLRVLLVAATPSGTTPLPGVAREIQILKETFSRAGRTRISHVELVENATYQKLLEAIAKEFDLIHFMGHGEFKDNKGFLIFEGENRVADWCEAEIIGDRVRNARVSLMVLNACKTAISSLDDTTIGVANAVHKAGVPSVVAMQQSIKDSIAPLFAESFYTSLTKGHSLEKCMTAARLTSKNAQRNEGVEWAIPALFSNAPMMINKSPMNARLRRPPARQTITIQGPVNNSNIVNQGNKSQFKQVKGKTSPN